MVRIAAPNNNYLDFAGLRKPHCKFSSRHSLCARLFSVGRSGMLGSGGPLDPHDAQSGVKVYVDVYDQTFRPSGECAKVRHGFRSYGDTAFNLDSHVVAVAEKKFFHVLDCVGWVPHISFPKRTEATLCRSRCLRCLSGTLSSCGTKPAFRS